MKDFKESFKNLEYRVAGHDPGSLPELRSAAGEGGVQEAGVTPGDPHLYGAAPRVDLLVNSDLHHQVVLERGGGENKAMIELLRSLSSEDSDHHHHHHHHTWVACDLEAVLLPWERLTNCPHRGWNTGGGQDTPSSSSGQGTLAPVILIWSPSLMITASFLNVDHFIFAFG